MGIPGRRGRIWIAAIALGMALSLPALGFDYWPKAIVRVAIDEQWQFGVEQWVNLTDDASRFKDTQTDLCLIYNGPVDWLGIGLGYKRVFAKTDDDWEIEDRPFLNFAVKTQVHGFGVIDRSRFEYRIPENEPDSWRYRHKLIVASPVTFTSLKIQPYTADEIFYSFDGQGFNQHRLYGGLFLPLQEKVRLELFYIWKLDKCDNDWQASNVLGTWVYFLF